MIREICKDETFLAQKAAPATAADLGVAQDLMETLIAHKDGCVGMAANMIGVNKRIIAFENDGEYMVMFNPEIIKKAEDRSREMYRVANEYTEDALRRTEEAIQMALEEVKQSRVRFRAASAEQMQKKREELAQSAEKQQ